MKKLKSLLIVLMTVLVLTGCSSNSTKDKEKDNGSSNIEQKEQKEQGKKIVAGNDVLECSMNVSGMKTDMLYTWRQGKISTILVSVAMDLGSYGVDDSMLDMIAEQLSTTYIDQMKQAYGIPENQEGFNVNYSVDKDTKSMVVEIFVDIDAIDPALLNDTKLFNKEDLDKSYDEIRKQVIASGATCN